MRALYQSNQVERDAATLDTAEEQFAATVLLSLANRTSAYGQYTADGRQFTAKDKLTEQTVRRHFRGEVTIGLHTTGLDNLCRWCCWDVDAHHGEDPDANWCVTQKLVARLEALGYTPIVEDSNGNGGYHVWVVFEQPVPAADAYAFAREMAPAGVESFPKQPHINPEPGEPGHYGNWVRLPGRHHRRDHWSRVLTPSGWVDWPAAAEILIDPPRSPAPPTAPATARPAHAAAGEARVERGEGTQPLQISSPPEHDWATVLRCLAVLGAPYVDEYDSWLKVGMIVHGVRPDAVGLATWEKWSRQSAKFEAGVCAEKWKSFGGDHSDPVGVGTLVTWASQAATSPSAGATASALSGATSGMDELQERTGENDALNQKGTHPMSNDALDFFNSIILPGRGELRIARIVRRGGRGGQVDFEMSDGRLVPGSTVPQLLDSNAWRALFADALRIDIGTIPKKIWGPAVQAFLDCIEEVDGETAEDALQELLATTLVADPPLDGDDPEEAAGIPGSRKKPYFTRGGNLYLRPEPFLAVVRHRTSFRMKQAELGVWLGRLGWTFHKLSVGSREHRRRIPCYLVPEGWPE